MMSSSVRDDSGDDQGSMSGGSVGFEELVEWMGPVGASGDRDASVRYRMDGEDYYFPLIDEKDISSGMVYRRPKEEVGPVRKDSKAKGCEEKENPQVPQYKTVVSESKVLEGIRENYHFPITYKTICPDAKQRIHTPPANCVTTYVAHLRAGLRFPLHPLFVDICRYYKIQLGQLMPNVIRTTVGFLMACRAFGCECSLELWRRLYYLSQKCTTPEGRGFFYISRRSARPVIVGPSSIHSWKNEFFYVKHHSFGNSGILQSWNNRKSLSNDVPDGYGRDYQDVETLMKYRFELNVGEDWSDTLMRHSGLECDSRLDIRKLSGCIWKG